MISFRRAALVFLALFSALSILYPQFQKTPLIYFRGVPALAYHTVDSDVDPEFKIYSIKPEDFEAQMKYLKENNYTAISLEEFFAAQKEKKNLPPHPIIITFDDGFESNYSVAWPILKKYGLKASFFVITSLVNTPGYLSWEELQEMRKDGAEIGSHTNTHIHLPLVSQQERKNELLISKDILEKNLGAPIYFMSYPFGDLDGAAAQDVKETGYLGACAASLGSNLPDTDNFHLKRLNVPWPRLGLLEFRLRLLRGSLIDLLNF